MAHCANCGAELLAGARFCTYCGTQVATAATVATAVPTAAYTYTGASGYSVLLVSLGSCTKTSAAELVEDLCGYTATEAKEIVRSVPLTLCTGLTSQQAACLAQALAEYGCEVSVYDANGYQTVTSGYTSVYDARGGLLAGAAGLLSMIGAANRIARDMIRPHVLPFGIRGGRPPMYDIPPRRPEPMRHTLGRGPAPMPAPQPMRSPMGGPGRMSGAPMPAPQPRSSRNDGPMGGRGNSRGDGPMGGRGGQGGPGSRGGQGGPMGGPGGRR